MGRAVRVMGWKRLCHPNVKCGLWSKELGLICVHGVSAGCQEASLRGFWWVTAVPHSRLQPPCLAAQLAASFGGLELFFFLELCQMGFGSLLPLPPGSLEV